MSRLLMVTSAVALFATPAIAQNVEAPTRGGVDDRSTLRAPDETQVDVDGDGDLETLKNGYTDEHAWVDAPVYAEGEQVGEVERVHYEDQEIDRIVIETGGIADIGGREVEIPVEDARLMTDDDGEAAFTLAMSAAELEALPEFDESKASDYPLSENPADASEQGGRENERR